MWFILGAQLGMIAAWMIAREFPNLSSFWVVLMSVVMSFILGVNAIIKIGAIQ